MEKLHYIYGLYSTLHAKKNYPDKIKYIGQSKSPEVRLKAHLNSAKKGAKGILYEWMRQQMERGAEIKMTLLQQCDREEINRIEKEFIVKHKSSLLNNLNNPNHTLEHLKKEIAGIRRSYLDTKDQLNRVLEEGGVKGILKEKKQLKIENKQLKHRIDQLEKFLFSLGYEWPLPKKLPRKKPD
jgi:DNA polymerase I-like protein with 3'-5' exonuclease and polymerase domains